MHSRLLPQLCSIENRAYVSLYTLSFNVCMKYASLVYTVYEILFSLISDNTRCVCVFVYVYMCMYVFSALCVRVFMEASVR